MKDLVLILIFAFFSNFIFAQNIELQLVALNCSEPIMDTISDFWIYKAGQPIDEILNKNNREFRTKRKTIETLDTILNIIVVREEIVNSIIHLPDTGKYYISLNPNEDFNNPSYDEIIWVKNYGLTVDTIKQHYLFQDYSPLVLHPSFLPIICCNKSCNGYQEDYYSNGNIRIKGEFKNGNRSGNITEFHPNGHLKYKLISHKIINRNTIFYYDFNENVIRKTIIAKSGVYGALIREKTYYENGIIKTTKKRRLGKMIVKNFDVHGNLKSKSKF